MDVLFWNRRFMYKFRYLVVKYSLKRFIGPIGNTTVSTYVYNLRISFDVTKSVRSGYEYRLVINKLIGSYLPIDIGCGKKHIPSLIIAGKII